MNNKPINIITSCYKWDKYIKDFLINLSSQTIFWLTTLILVHNDPSEYELNVINNFLKENPWSIKHIIVAREPISVSMNRAIENSNWKYIISWDIDDIRTNNSIELQYKTLHENDDIYFTYWDFIIVNKYNETNWKIIVSPDFNKESFKKSMYCGPFRAWKKSIHAKIGYFDEQLKSWADFDFVLRVSYNFNMKKTEWLLWYYLNENTWLSTWQKNLVSLQQKELYIINKRYNIFDKINFFTKNDKYNIYKIEKNKELIPIWKYISNYYVKKFWILNYLKSFIFTVKYWLLRIAKFIYLKIN